MRLRDGGSAYGWISIGLHWAGAVLIVALLVIGASIKAPQGGLQDSMLRLHTTIAIGFYLVLWARVIWRFKVGHPDRLPRQKPIYHAIGKPFHYMLLLATVAMLVSGPLMAWSGDIPLRIWTLALGNPIGPHPALFGLARTLHIGGATVLGWGVLVHILAVLKHAAFDRDGALDRILAPAKPVSPGAAKPAPSE